jgi:tetratricopeptide (TPR) repeat protein
LRAAGAAHMSSPLPTLRPRIDPALAAPLATQIPLEQRPAGFLLDLGLTCAAIGDAPAAIAALQQATALKSRLGAGWLKLSDLLAQTGDMEGSEAARAACTGLTKRETEPPRLAKIPSAGKLEAAERQIRDLIERGPPQDAGRVIRDHLKTAPTDIVALRILGEIGARGGHFAAVETLLERALELAPTYLSARYNYAFVLMHQGKAVQALPHVELLLAQEPRNAEYRTLLASALASMGEYPRAISVFEGLLKDSKQRQPRFWLSYAHALRYIGRRADAVRAYRTCIELAPSLGEAYWGIANLKNERFSEADLLAMRAQLASVSVSSDDRVNLHYALGRALEQAADYTGSFKHYAEGASLRRATNGYNADEWSAEMRRSTEFFTASRLAELSGCGCPDPAPIFILGLPRAGSTLIEQILASHSAVEGTQELPEIANIMRLVGQSHNLGPQSRYPERLAELTPPEIAALGARYIERTRIYRRTEKPFFIDKMPANWAYVGLILAILPNAKIIDARRHPMASCFSAFKQLFGSGANYSYDLGDLGRYYNDYLDMMAHYDKAAPGRVHRVFYEDMVEDTEPEIGRLLASCKLTLEPACLRFWESTRAVGTPSSEQVRQPIFREGLDHWRHFEPWLKPLSLALTRPAGTVAWDDGRRRT